MMYIPAQDVSESQSVNDQTMELAPFPVLVAFQSLIAVN